MYWNQKDQAVLELGGHPEKLFLLRVVAAELAYQQNADVFGTVEDLAAHKAKLAELEAKRKELCARFPSTLWRSAHRADHVRRRGADHIQACPR